MVIGIVEWRVRIGLFSSPPGCKRSTRTFGLLLSALPRPRLGCTGCVLAVIAAILVIGGVERNPGFEGKASQLM